MINADNPRQWKADIAAAVDLYNIWFMQNAPEAYRTTRVRTAASVKRAFQLTEDLLNIAPSDLRASPIVLQTLRMSTAPPIARDRLVGLAHTTKSLVERLEKGELPRRMKDPILEEHLGRICRVIEELLDVDLFPWVAAKNRPSELQRERAATVVADRLCGAESDPIVRNAQEQRQLSLIRQYLAERGYQEKTHPAGEPLTNMEGGTYACRMNLLVAGDVRIPIDTIIQPKQLRPNRLPILIEAKSAGDYTNPNKRRKEEAQKINQLRATFGEEVEFLLFLCGYFDGNYLAYEAMEGIDWIWEHRMSDFDRLGI